MILLGLLLVLLAGGAIALAATEETSRYILFGYTFELTSFGMFIAGAVTAAVLLLGIAMISSGGRRSAHRRRQTRAARAESSNRMAKLENEKRELERKLERERQPEHQPIHQPAHATETEPTDRLVAGGVEDTRRR